MNHTEQFRCSFSWNTDMVPGEYIERGKQQAQRELALKLMDLLMRPGYEKRYTVVHISTDETDLSSLSYERPLMTYTIGVELSEAEHMEVKIWAPPDYASMSTAQLSYSALEEIKRRVHKFFNTPRVGPG